LSIQRDCIPHTLEWSWLQAPDFVSLVPRIAGNILQTIKLYHTDIPNWTALEDLLQAHSHSHSQSRFHLEIVACRGFGGVNRPVVDVSALSTGPPTHLHSYHNTFDIFFTANSASFPIGLVEVFVEWPDVL
jgi:hypothetical protein